MSASFMTDAEWEDMKARFKRDFDRIWQECLEQYGLEPPEEKSEDSP